jgi:hypothetical protein
MAIGRQEGFYSGMEVLSDDMGFDQQSRIDQTQFRTSDFWNNGVLRDPNGLSNMSVSIDAITQTLINVSRGVAFANGYRISIDADQAFDPNFLSATTNGLCTPHSSGNKAVPLASYTLGAPNYIWAEFITQISTGRTSVSFIDGSLHYPDQYDGYGILVTTNNPPGNPTGITNSVFLGTVYGQGVGTPLVSTAAGLSDSGKVYASIRPIMPTVNALVSGTVRGSTANAGGSQREILQGTVSTPDLRFAAITPSTMDVTQRFTAVEFQGTSDLKTPQIFVDDPADPNILFRFSGVTYGEIDMSSTTVLRILSGGGGADPAAGVVKIGTGTNPTAVSGLAATFDDTQNLTVKNNINANAGKLQENGIALIPAGTRMPFFQASVPAGWSAVASTNDFFLHAVSNGGGGGTAAYTSPISGFNLQHSHNVSNHSHSISTDGSHTHNLTEGANRTGGGLAPTIFPNGFANDNRITVLSGGNNFGGTECRGVTNSGGSHNHGSNTGNTAPGTDNQLSTAYRFSYLDVVIGAK